MSHFYLEEVHWSEWTYSKQSSCDKFCTRESFRERQCKKPENSKIQTKCLGKASGWTRQPCSDGDCGMEKFMNIL